MKHPAVYSDKFLSVFADWLRGREHILDPFGGTGKLKLVRPDAVCMDIELEWATMSGLCADAMLLPFRVATFDAVCTSPTYGNRMADKFVDGTHRITYTNYLGHALREKNTGQLQWGDRYKLFHNVAWLEVRRVLTSGGVLILNIKDHIRGGKQMNVTEWHKRLLQEIGFKWVDAKYVRVSGNGFGANRYARVDVEGILKFIAP